MKIRIFLLSCVLTGCMVGPNYYAPNPELHPFFCEDPHNDACCNLDEDLAEWWHHFDDPFLESLIHEALDANFDLLVAVEKVCQARAQYWNQFTQMLPELDYDFLATRSRNSQTLTRSAFFGPKIQNFYQINLDLIWEIDIFGKYRRGERASHFTWEATAEDARNVRVMVLAEVATSYITILGYQQNLSIALQKIALDEDILSMIQSKFEAGLAPEQDVETAIATLEVDRAAFFEIEKNLHQAIYALAPLLGRPPETLFADFATCRPLPCVAEKIPVGLPSELLCRRPDIRAAERRLGAATEQIGVAVADLFPSFSLTGTSTSFSANPLQGANFGYASNSISQLLKAPSRIWGLGIFASGFLWDFGKRAAAVGIQVSLRNQACWNYQKTVITALQEVEDSLVAYYKEQERLNSFKRQELAYARNVDFVLNLYNAGIADYIQVEQAKEIWLNTLNTVMISQQTLAANLINVYRALGGGWQ